MPPVFQTAFSVAPTERRLYQSAAPRRACPTVGAPHLAATTGLLLSAQEGFSSAGETERPRNAPGAAVLQSSVDYSADQSVAFRPGAGPQQSW